MQRGKAGTESNGGRASGLPAARQLDHQARDRGLRTLPVRRLRGELRTGVRDAGHGRLPHRTSPTLPIAAGRQPTLRRHPDPKVEIGGSFVDCPRPCDWHCGRVERVEKAVGVLTRREAHLAGRRLRSRKDDVDGVSGLPEIGRPGSCRCARGVQLGDAAETLRVRCPQRPFAGVPSGTIAHCATGKRRQGCPEVNILACRVSAPRLPGA